MIIAYFLCDPVIILMQFVSQSLCKLVYGFRIELCHRQGDCRAVAEQVVYLPHMLVVHKVPKFGLSERVRWVYWLIEGRILGNPLINKPTIYAIFFAPRPLVGLWLEGAWRMLAWLYLAAILGR